MTTSYLAGDIATEEGRRLVAYRDTRGVWTIGDGHTGPEVHEGLVWTNAQCDAALRADIAAVYRGLDEHLPWWRTLADVRQDVLADMAFNLGLKGLLEFRQMLAAVQAGNYHRASADMLISAWANEVGGRATRLAAMMRLGVRPQS